ncbi:MAG TPA: CRTAC1 family protein [Vicinamibacterales bacterium]|nr:CRTAC1 family protein [Vicinamibacterales bacterium]
MRLSRATGFLLLIFAGGCSGSDAGRATGAAPGAAFQADWFVDRARDSGLDFVHVNGMSGQLYMPEVLAPGVALFDVDNDGDLDVYLVQGQRLGIRDSGSGTRDSALHDRLYRNDLRVNADGTRTPHFTDVTAASRIDARGYGMGVAAGDFNNDGWIDLYLTKFDAPNQLLRNNGDGTFADVSKASRTDQHSWSVSASFVDIDRDGWLDLYVGNYLRYSLEASTQCFGPSGAPNYCTPDTYAPLPDRLYRNRRDGTFTDVSASAQVTREFGPALGVSTADFDGDGWIDIYVTNDGKENQLWRNHHDGTFENIALLAGVALPVTGKAEASMGVDAGDFDDDGDEDLVMTELTTEGSNLYVNDGTGVFTDMSARSMIGPVTLAFTGFGTGWLDFDNDGRLDLLAVNGTVQIIEALRQARDPFPMHQKRQLLRNAGDGRFEDVSSRAGAAFALSEVGRGAAFGDVDNDGDVDVLIGNNNGPTRLLINQARSGRHWLGLRLVGPLTGPPKGGPYDRGGGTTDRGGRLQAAQGRDMLGARVEIVRKNGPSLWRRARADGSYASANDPRVHVGLGDAADPVSVRVRWPSGRMETWTDVAIDRYTTLTEGGGK